MCENKKWADEAPAYDGEESKHEPKESGQYRVLTQWRARLAQEPHLKTDIHMFDNKLTSCPLCKCYDIRYYDTDFTGKTIDRCHGCGIKFLNPQYSDEYLDEYYSHYIGPVEIESTDEYTAANRWRYMVHEHYLSLIESRIQPGKFLSVGCGDGLELEVAKSRGWNANGFDVNPKVTEAVSKRLGVEVLEGNFLKTPYAPGSFDCVYLHHVLEHPKNPQEYVTKIHEILKPGGMLFLACPNNESIAKIFKTWAGKLGIKKRRGKHYDTWHHIFYYSPANMANVLTKHYGFSVVHVGTGFGDSTRTFSEARIKRGIQMSRWNRYVPCVKDVFILMATKH